MSEFGRTWWGKRWLRVLDQLGLTYPDNRLSKARTLVRKDAVDLMDVAPGELSAWVDEPRKAFGVSLTMTRFDDGQWKDCFATLARRLSNLVDLSDDRLPNNIDRQLEPVGLTLFPADKELSTSCPCQDRSSVCIHVIAMVHAFSKTFDNDPFALCVLRGLDRESFLDGIRGARTPTPAPTPTNPGGVTPRDAGAFYSASGNLDEIIRGV